MGRKLARMLKTTLTELADDLSKLSVNENSLQSYLSQTSPNEIERCFRQECDDAFVFQNCDMSPILKSKTPVAEEYIAILKLFRPKIGQQAITAAANANANAASALFEKSPDLKALAENIQTQIPENANMQDIMKIAMSNVQTFVANPKTDLSSLQQDCMSMLSGDNMSAMGISGDMISQLMSTMNSSSPAKDATITEVVQIQK